MLNKAEVLICSPKLCNIKLGQYRNGGWLRQNGLKKAVFNHKSDGQKVSKEINAKEIYSQYTQF